MKRANGTGGVRKLSGKRRKPYAAFITESLIMVDGKAVQKKRYIGYFECKKEALIELGKYNISRKSEAQNS